MNKNRKLQIWTDGACKGNPGPGGWGAYLVWGDKALELCGGEVETTNNQMELTAVIEAEWMPQWKKRGWKTAAGKPVKNIELWQKLDQLVSTHDIEWKWVKGHAGEPGNEKADELANRGVPKKA